MVSMTNELSATITMLFTALSPSEVGLLHGRMSPAH
jgi:hypothetical protein